MTTDEITGKIIKASYNVHNTLGAGFFEKVYENALVIELEENGLMVQQQYPIEVLYKDQSIGEFVADLLVEDEIIVELKAVQNLDKIHHIQVVNYLNATGHDIGLLINFGQSVEVKRKHREYIKNKG